MATMARSRPKILALTALRAVGGFAIARWLTRGKLRILGYHGTAFHDEHVFRPGLFMHPDTFSARIATLVRLGYPVMDLGEACAALDAGRLPPCATVITIDDGWVGTFAHMGPVLRRHQLPATLYVSSYYVDHQVQVVYLAVQYLIWKAGGRVVHIEMGGALSGRFDLRLEAERGRLFEAFNLAAATTDGAEAQQRLLNALAAQLGVPWEATLTARVCAYMTREEAQALATTGVDLQLHTHRHRFPADSLVAARQELDDNRRALAGLTTRPLEHFCYPSGVYTPEQVAWLPALGVTTATTTTSGLNDRETPRGELRRFLDADDIHPIEFEAWLSGLLWIGHRLIGRR